MIECCVKGAMGGVITCNYMIVNVNYDMNITFLCMLSHFECISIISCNFKL